MTLTMERAMTILSSVEFNHFKQNDWDMFAGVESERPLIGEDMDYIYVIDGDQLIAIGGLDGVEESITIPELTLPSEAKAFDNLWLKYSF